MLLFRGMTERSSQCSVQCKLPSVGPSSKSDPLITVVPSLLKKVLSFIPSSPSSIFLRNLTLLDINHDTIVSSFFNDPQILVQLAFLLHPQIGGQALEKITLDYMEEEEDADVEVLDGPPPVFMNPRRKRAVKVKERLDDGFLSRSKRVAKKLEGFKNEESAKQAREATEEVDEPMPLAIIPGPAPHLSKEIIESIAQGFLQIQPEAIFAALLDKDDIDE